MRVSRVPDGRARVEALLELAVGRVGIGKFGEDAAVLRRFGMVPFAVTWPATTKTQVNERPRYLGMSRFGICCVQEFSDQI